MRRARKNSGWRLAAVLLAGVAAARAQEPLAPPAPLIVAPGAASSASSVALTVAAAQRAQDLGLPSIAAEIYRQLLEMPGANRPELTLALATALLDADRAADAEETLAALPPPHGAAWRLRAGLAALERRKRDAAQAQWDAIVADDVAPADRPWYWFFTGALYDTATPIDVKRANEFYRRAEEAAPTELARARFQLAGEQVRVRLRGAKPTDADLAQAREIAERFVGRAPSYEAIKTYAVLLAANDQRSDAVEYLRRVLMALPAPERGVRDEVRFLLGLIGDRGQNSVARNALTQLLESGGNPERQRQALELLAAASQEEPMRGQFRADLKRLIASKPAHPILENLWLYHAQLALAEKDFTSAEEDADALLKQFPLTPLRVHAYGVLTQSAWERRRFRLASDFARRTREAARTGPAGALLSPRARANLGVLEAEASFRAGDFRPAADAYAAVLRDHAAELEPKRLGELMYQRVLAEIRTGSGDAGKVLDELARSPAFDAENRWQAEWSLARALQLQNEAGVREAYARVDALLGQPVAGAAAPSPELRARMMWLRVKLAAENGAYARTIELADALLAAPLHVDARLKDEISSIAMSMKAQAELALGGKNETPALETLKRLRASYPASDAAIYSYLIESEHYAAQDRIGDARNALVKLTDTEAYKNSPYVPLALFRLALLSEQLGGKENLEEANKRIEDLIELGSKSTVPAQADLIFTARLRQGDILRKLNDFPKAQFAYEDLVNKYPRRPDVVFAQLGLAAARNAQSLADPAQADAAQFIYEQLRDRVDAPPDVRVEAGYNLGKLLERRGKTEAAAAVWWNDVAIPFLVDEKRLIEPAAKRLYWLGRTLCDLGDLQERNGKLGEAKSAYLLVVEKRLPYAAIARAKLQQLGVALPQ